jgi:TRAP-type C4-dicarboxylate transport system substrate-binding protein
MTPTNLPKTLAIAALLACLAGISHAQKMTELKLATSAPAGSPWAKQIDRLAADVAAETNNTVKLNVFYSSQLGTENDVLAQLMRGRVDMGVFTIGSVALQVPEAILPGLYHYYDSAAQRDCLLDQHMLQPFSKAVAPKGMHMLGWFEVGTGQFSGKKSFAGPDDIKGLKVGVTTNKAINRFFQTYGAIPVATPIAEATSNIGTGLVDVYPTVAAFYVPSGLNKVAPVWTITNYSWQPAALLVGKRTWDSLTPEQRAGVERGVAKVPGAQIRAEIAGAEKAMIAKHKEGGGQVFETTPELQAAWKKPMPGYYQELLKDLGANGKTLFAAMEAGKKSCGN